jgi:hypothetical protein
MRSKLFGIRLPLAVFLISILAFLAAGYLTIHITLMGNLTEDGNYLNISMRTIKFKLPRSWRTPYPYVTPFWENESICAIYLLNAEEDAMTYIIHYKTQESVQGFIRGQNITDEFSVAIFEIERFYEWFLERSQNATLQFVENGTIKVSERQASYSKIQIKNISMSTGENISYNITGIFISSLTERNLLEIIFYTWRDQAWNATYNDFQILVNSLVVKYENE